MDSFKGRIYDLVEEVSWRGEDDFEVMNRILELLYKVLKNYVVIQPQRVPIGPILPQDRLRIWEEQFGMLPIWMTDRDHTLRDEAAQSQAATSRHVLPMPKMSLLPKSFSGSHLRSRSRGLLLLLLRAFLWTSQSR